MAGLGPATHDFPMPGSPKTWVTGPSVQTGHDTARVGFKAGWYKACHVESMGIFDDLTDTRQQAKVVYSLDEVVLKPPPGTITSSQPS
jgi:hypothetical protein